MTSEQPIAIVIICDNHFSVLFAALLKSIDKHHVSDEKIDFYIVSDKISATNKAKLTQCIDPNYMTFHWIDMDKAIPPQWSIPLDNSSFPMNVYVRLFLPYFIPEHLEKVLFLDVDMILKEDISKLWNTDLKDHIIAGVVDRAKVVSNPWGGIPNYEALGMDPDTKYFNAGLQLINPIKWRKEKITDKLLQIGEDNKGHVKWGDQYYLNVAFENQWLELDPRWNWFASADHDAPYLIHFIGNKPIYTSYSFDESFKKDFFYYLNMTPWKGYKPATKNQQMLKKLFNLLQKKVTRVFSS